MAYAFFAHAFFLQSTAVPYPAARIHDMRLTSGGLAGESATTQERRVAVEVGRASKKERQQAGSEGTCQCEGQEFGPTQGETGDARSPSQGGG